MNSTALVFCSVLLCLTAGPSVEVVTVRGKPQLVEHSKAWLETERTSELVGEVLKGELVKVDQSQVWVKCGGKQQSVPVSQVLRLLFQDAEQLPVCLGEPTSGVIVRFTDGGRLWVDSVEIKSGQATLHSKELGTLSLPAEAIRSLRFLKAENTKLTAEWEKLLNRNLQSDAIVVSKESRKGDRRKILDHIAGAVGDIQNQTVQFLLENEVLQIKQEKLFGILFYRRKKPLSETSFQCRLLLKQCGSLPALNVTTTDDKLTATVLWGRLTVPLSAVDSIDYSLGNVRFLSELKPSRVDYTPYFDIVWKFKRDRNLDGGRLQLDGRTFQHGLCIHSRTVLEYDLNGEYRRLWAVTGIDQAVRPLGHVHLVLEGDGRKLYDSTVTGTDPPRVLDLDVSGVDTLRITVDFGKFMDIADHLDLCDAKLLK